MSDFNQQIEDAIREENLLNEMPNEENNAANTLAELGNNPVDFDQYNDVMGNDVFDAAVGQANEPVNEPANADGKQPVYKLATCFVQWGKVIIDIIQTQISLMESMAHIRSIDHNHQGPKGQVQAPYEMLQRIPGANQQDKHFCHRDFNQDAATIQPNLKAIYDSMKVSITAWIGDLETQRKEIEVLRNNIYANMANRPHKDQRISDSIREVKNALTMRNEKNKEFKDMFTDNKFSVAVPKARIANVIGGPSNKPIQKKWNRKPPQRRHTFNQDHFEYVPYQQCGLCTMMRNPRSLYRQCGMTNNNNDYYRYMPRNATAFNAIPGGLADDRSVNEFDRVELQKGIGVEREHTSDDRIATEIAMDHLTEDPQYYTKLQVFENQMNDEDSDPYYSRIRESSVYQQCNVCRYK